MPRVPGRESTRLTYPLGDLLVSSFLHHGMDDKIIGNRRCVIEGCDHFLRNCITGANASGPTVVVHADDIDKPLGMACQHCSSQILL